WKDVKARQADFKEFLKAVPVLTANQQMAAVSARLKEHNPGFGGRVVHKIDGRVVTEIALGGQVTDPSPLRAVPGLKVVSCSEGPLSDLSPLKGLSLTRLSVAVTRVHDLSPLKGMKLTELDLGGCQQVRDLLPLKGMPLTVVSLAATGVSDLSPLTGMK